MAIYLRLTENMTVLPIGFIFCFALGKKLLIVLSSVLSPIPHPETVQFSHIKKFERLICCSDKDTNSHDEHGSALCCELLTKLGEFRNAAWFCSAEF